MKNLESIGDDSKKDDNNKWDSLTNWTSEIENKKTKKKEAIDSYEAASEAFRMDFNERATGPEQFDEWINSGEDGISREEVEYKDQKIKVYHLTGHSFLSLVHCINYRTKADGILWPGVYEKAKAIQDNPSNWSNIALENNPKNVNSFGIKTGKANNISTSLVSDKVPKGYWGDDEKAIYYGFSNLGHRGIISASYRDVRTQEGWTSHVNDENFHKIDSSKHANASMIPGWVDDSHTEEAGGWRTIQTISNIEAHNQPNEVAIDRYEEDNGRPILPNFIYCPNLFNNSIDELTNDQKRHAVYFNIPIVIFHQESYKNT